MDDETGGAKFENLQDFEGSPARSGTVCRGKCGRNCFGMKGGKGGAPKKCTKAAGMNFKLMAERTRYLKENPKGVSEMCKAFEDTMMEGFKEGLTETALRILKAGKYTLEEIVSISGLSLGEVKELQTGQSI